MNLIAIDFETANRNPASVCSVGISLMDEYGEVEEKYYSLIKPEENVSAFDPFNIHIHGIKPKDVEKAPSFKEVYEEIVSVLTSGMVCAHNARFDMMCLKAACENNHLSVPDITYFDTVLLSRKVYPELEHHRLNDMCDYLGIELNHHNAMSDSMGCLLITAKAMEAMDVYEIEELLKAVRIRPRSLKEL